MTLFALIELYNSTPQELDINEIRYDTAFDIQSNIVECIPKYLLVGITP